MIAALAEPTTANRLMSQFDLPWPACQHVGGRPRDGHRRT
jgi:hypothetical protein